MSSHIITSAAIVVVTGSQFRASTIPEVTIHTIGNMTHMTPIVMILNMMISFMIQTIQMMKNSQNEDMTIITIATILGFQTNTRMILRPNMMNTTKHLGITLIPTAKNMAIIMIDTKIILM